MPPAASMPDTRRHRGMGPKDEDLFTVAVVQSMRVAVEEMSWLLSRGYAEVSSLKLVGDRHRLAERQRIAVRRCACSDSSLELRRSRAIDRTALRGATLDVDAFNLLITIESALSGGVILVGRDGACRDLASIHKTYRTVEETLPAIVLVGRFVAALGVESMRWWIDSPVSNSGRLRAFLMEVAAAEGWNWEAETTANPDRLLAASSDPIVSSDSWILDNAAAWVNLAAWIIDAEISSAAVAPLGTTISRMN